MTLTDLIRAIMLDEIQHGGRRPSLVLAPERLTKVWMNELAAGDRDIPVKGLILCGVPVEAHERPEVLICRTVAKLEEA